MKATKRVFALVLVIFFCVATVFAARGGGKNGRELTFLQDGVVVTEVESGSPFEIRGTGFKSWQQVNVCFNPGICESVLTDRDGTFTQTRIDLVLFTKERIIETYIRQGKGARLAARASILLVVS